MVFGKRWQGTSCSRFAELFLSAARAFGGVRHHSRFACQFPNHLLCVVVGTKGGREQEARGIQAIGIDIEKFESRFGGIGHNLGGNARLIPPDLELCEARRQGRDAHYFTGTACCRTHRRKVRTLIRAKLVPTSANNLGITSQRLADDVSSIGFDVPEVAETDRQRRCDAPRRDKDQPAFLLKQTSRGGSAVIGDDQPCRVVRGVGKQNTDRANQEEGQGGWRGRRRFNLRIRSLVSVTRLMRATRAENSNGRGQTQCDDPSESLNMASSSFHSDARDDRSARIISEGHVFCQENSPNASRNLPALDAVFPGGNHAVMFRLRWVAWIWAALFSAVAPLNVGAAGYPTYDELSAGAFKVRLLPGHREFAFSLYGIPGDLNQVTQLVQVLTDRHLGNAFDPGPAARPGAKPIFDYLATVGWPLVAYPGCADMQIKGGRCVLGDEDRAALAALERAGVFHGIQLGEWGYYFHNLSCTERWWRDVYGAEFESMKHLMKPPGLAGYDRRPSTRRECYETLKDYFVSRSHDLLNRVVSVTGHSHYEAYAAEWGARCVGLELGENIAFTQSKLAFARGASRQWNTPWSVQVSPWFHGACTTSGPLRREGRDARGLDAGHSLSFYERMWLHAWFAGAAMVTPENSLAIFFETPAAPWTLTSHGEKAAEVFAFMRTHARGIPWMPVAVLLDHYAGYNGYMDKPWGILEPTPGDRELRDLFDDQLFPGSDHIHHRPNADNPESSYLRPTPYGEIFDVLLTSVGPGVLPSYPAILLAGDIEFTEALVERLTEALRRGSTVMLNPRHQQALGDRFEVLARLGRVEVLEPATDPTTQRGVAISNQRLKKLVRDLVPIEVTGDPIQYQINRLPNGWAIELVNNDGVAKKPSEPAVVDARGAKHVFLAPRVAWDHAWEWHSGRMHRNPASIDLVIPPGQTRFVQFEEP